MYLLIFNKANYQPRGGCLHGSAHRSRDRVHDSSPIIFSSHCSFQNQNRVYKTLSHYLSCRFSLHYSQKPLQLFYKSTLSSKRHPTLHRTFEPHRTPTHSPTSSAVHRHQLMASTGADHPQSLLPPLHSLAIVLTCFNFLNYKFINMGFNLSMFLKRFVFKFLLICSLFIVLTNFLQEICKNQIYTIHIHVIYIIYTTDLNQIYRIQNYTNQIYTYKFKFPLYVNF